MHSNINILINSLVKLFNSKYNKNVYHTFILYLN